MRRYLIASFAARLAEEGMPVAVTLLVAERSGSMSTAGFVLAAWLAPHILVAPLVGTLAARAGRPQRFYAFALAGTAGVVVAITVLIDRIWTLPVLLLALLGGAFSPVVSGGLSSLVATLLPAERRGRGYSLDSVVYNAAAIAGMAVVSAIAVVASAAWAGALLAASAALAAVLIAGLPGRSPARTSSVRLREDYIAGAVVLWRNRGLRAITVATGIAYLGIGGLTVSAVRLATTWREPEYGGFLTTVFAVGATLAALAVVRWSPGLTPFRLACSCLLLTGGALAAAVFFPYAGIALFLFALAGAGDGPLLSSTLQIRAELAPEERRAQVFTTGAAIKLTAASVGAALAGVLAVPPTWLLAGIAGCHLLAGGLLWVWTRTLAPVPAGSTP